MKTLKQLALEHDALLAQADVIMNKAKTEGRESTEDENTQVAALIDQADGIDVEMKAMVEAKKTADGNAARIAAARGRTSQSRGTVAGANMTGVNGDSGDVQNLGGSIIDMKANFTEDPKKGFKTSQEFFKQSLDASLGRGKALEDPRMVYLAVENVDLRATVGSDEMTTLRDADGGFFVPVSFSPDPLTLTPEGDFTLGRVQNIPMESPSVEIAARVDKDHSSGSVSGGTTVGRNLETTEVAASQSKYEKIRLTANDLDGATFITNNLIADSAISAAALIQRGFSDQIPWHMVGEKFEGSGVGEYLGFMNSPALITIAKETSQTADTINYINLVKMRARSYRYQQSIWQLNQDCYPTISQMVDPEGHYIWQQSGRDGSPEMLLGRPIEWTEHAQTVGDLGDISLVNWSEYLEGVYQAMQTSESMHVRFLNKEKVFMISTRNAGAPWWKTALTPKNSTATISPFVTLAARA